MEHTYHLSIRRNIFEDAKATPFHNVLSWLCQSADYFTAASVALNLLNDIDAVRDLRTSPDADEGVLYIITKKSANINLVSYYYLVCHVGLVPLYCVENRD